MEQIIYILLRQPADLSEAILKLKSDYHLKIFGGCCGTDSSHMEKIAKISEVT